MRLSQHNAMKPFTLSVLLLLYMCLLLKSLSKHKLGKGADLSSNSMRFVSLLPEFLNQH